MNSVASSCVNPCRTRARCTARSSRCAGIVYAGTEPPARAQPVGEVEERELVVDVLAELPRDRRDAVARVAVEQDLERAELRDLLREKERDVVAPALDLPVSLAA